MSKVIEQLHAIVDHGPLWPGDTLSHEAASECVSLGWAQRDEHGMFIATAKGEAVAAQERA
jgi:hypothetical protein